MSNKKRMSASEIKPIILGLSLPPIFGRKEMVEAFCSYLSIDEKDWGFQNYGNRNKPILWVHYNIMRTAQTLAQEGKLVCVGRGIYAFPTEKNIPDKWIDGSFFDRNLKIEEHNIKTENTFCDSVEVFAENQNLNCVGEHNASFKL